MKRIRTEPHGHGAEGDERIRTAVPAPSTETAYERRTWELWHRVEGGLNHSCVWMVWHVGQSTDGQRWFSSEHEARQFIDEQVARAAQ